MISGFIAAFDNYIRQSFPASETGLDKTRSRHYKIIFSINFNIPALRIFMKMFIAFCRKYSLMPEPLPFNASVIRSETGGYGTVLKFFCRNYKKLCRKYRRRR